MLKDIAEAMLGRRPFDLVIRNVQIVNVFSASIVSYRPGQPTLAIDGQQEKQKRLALVDAWINRLVLETPDPIIDRMFAFSKIRACESITTRKAA